MADPAVEGGINSSSSSPPSVVASDEVAPEKPIDTGDNNEPIVIKPKSDEELAIEEAARQEIQEKLSGGGVGEPSVEPVAPPTPQQSSATGPSEIDNNLIDIINSMEADRQKFIAHVRSKISNQETEFERTKSENERLKKRVAELEQCLRQNNINLSDASSATTTTTGNSKSRKNNKKDSGGDSDDILTQAKALLFEKTKICKQQEQQLAAYKAQVDATKEVLNVTKEMLCLRNIEHDHAEARYDTMDLKLKNERARQQLSDKKLEVAKKMYADLRTEYDLQSGIFKQLRAGFEEKIAVLLKQIETLKS